MFDKQVLAYIKMGANIRNSTSLSPNMSDQAAVPLEHYLDCEQHARPDPRGDECPICVRYSRFNPPKLQSRKLAM